MSKLFWIIIFGIAAYLLLGRSRRRRAARAAAPATAVTMVRCAHCKVHLPVGDSVTDGDLHYCSEEHRRLGRG